MKLCVYCSAENPEDQTYCGKCGAVLKELQNCGNCGAPCPQSAHFCHKCGKALRAQEGQGPAPFALAGYPRPRPFGLVLVVIYTALGASLMVVAAALGFLAGAMTEDLGTLIPAMLYALLGTLGLAACYGLWTSQRWGLNLTIFLYVLYILVRILPDILVAAMGHDAPIPSSLRVFTDKTTSLAAKVTHVVFLLANVAAVSYLTSPERRLGIGHGANGQRQRKRRI